MKKKLIMSILFLATALVVSFSYTFAANETSMNPVEGVRNFVGGAENVMEDAASGVANGVRNVTGAVENTMEDVTHNNGNNNPTENNSMENAVNRVTGAITTDDGGNYTARRTADTTSLGGMTSNTWTWIIVVLAAIAIIALIWAYARGKNYSSTNNNNDDNNQK